MYARVTTYQVQPAKVEEVRQIADESIVPAIQQQHGFKSFMNLIDRSTGKSMLITVFETETDMKAGVSNGFVQQQSAKIAPFLVGTLVSEFYEVNVQG